MKFLRKFGHFPSIYWRCQSWGMATGWRPCPAACPHFASSGWRWPSANRQPEPFLARFRQHLAISPAFRNTAAAIGTRGVLVTTAGNCSMHTTMSSMPGGRGMQLLHLQLAARRSAPPLLRLRILALLLLRLPRQPRLLHSLVHEDVAVVCRQEEARVVERWERGRCSKPSSTD